MTNEEWKKDSENSETENSIKIVSDMGLDLSLNPAQNITIKKMEITFHKRNKRPESYFLKKLLRLKHNQEDKNENKNDRTS